MRARHVGQALLAGGYLGLLVVTRRQQHWGATAQEITEPLPGDDLLPAAKLQSTTPSPSAPRPSRSGRGWPRWAIRAAPACTATTSWSGASAPAPSTGSTRTWNRWSAASGCRSRRGWRGLSRSWTRHALVLWQIVSGSRRPSALDGQKPPAS